MDHAFEADHIEAQICPLIVSRPADVTTRQVKSPTGASEYVATIDDPIFFAAMNRGCSWIKPEHKRPIGLLPVAGCPAL